MDEIDQLGIGCIVWPGVLNIWDEHERPALASEFVGNGAAGVAHSEGLHRNFSDGKALACRERVEGEGANSLQPHGDQRRRHQVA